MQQGRRIPFTSTVMVNEEDCLAIIDQMRVSIPEEIREAKRIEGERERITAQAQEEAERIISLAQDEASHLVDDHEVLDQATQRATTIIQDAIQEGHQIKLEAEDYVVDVLEQLDSLLTSFHNTVRNGINTLLRSREEEEEETKDEEGIST